MLIRLSRGDLLEYMELGGWFRKVKDPILLEFLKVWGRIEVEGQDPSQVRNDILTAYRKQKRAFNEYRGFLAEVFMAQVLWAIQAYAPPRAEYALQGRSMEIGLAAYVKRLAGESR